MEDHNKETSAGTGQNDQKSDRDARKLVEGSDKEYKAGNSPYSDFNTSKPLEEGKTDQKQEDDNS